MSESRPAAEGRPGPAGAAAMQRVAAAVDELTDFQLGMLDQMVMHWRANLPASTACLVDVLDRFKEVVIAAMADRYSATVAEVETLITQQTAGDGING